MRSPSAVRYVHAIRRSVIGACLFIASGLLVAQASQPATLMAKSVVCLRQSDIAALIGLYQSGDNSAIMQYFVPGKCALTRADQAVTVVNHVPGRSWAVVRSASGSEVYTFSQRVLMSQQ